MSHPEDEDPAALFRAAIGEVTPLRKDVEPAPAAPRPKPRARMAERDDAEAAGEFARLLRDNAPLEAGDVASYRRDNLPMGSAPGEREFVHVGTDPDLVRATIAAARA